MNVVVTGGGTGGHFYPAYILYEKLKNSGKIAEIYYFGSDYGIEKKLVAELNLNYRLLKARGFIGKSVFDKIKAIILNFYSILYCLYFFLKNKVDAVVAAGGYVSLPSLTAAVILRKKIYIQEQNSYPGITTRLFAFAAKYVFIAFPEAKNYLKIDSEKIILSITPVRDDFIEKTGNLIEKPKTLTIIGGSQGSKKLNEIVAELIDFLKKES
ncbi:MAG TPA: UDP-N-acetylglucosamine--N-acetylmuramyl-(pentapeptide) pyrophosphoryl-undecaprenol N-acetylglucosamine transferase, partial [bacterium]|nr:UDP-N-acetylglucosamine--N-acetylmuramyl-(pentapeptide) pyrophosphoryl-undecaprenol N-acetylglucosamine transferase [bacterium]